MTVLEGRGCTTLFQWTSVFMSGDVMETGSGKATLFSPQASPQGLGWASSEDADSKGART